MTVPELLNQLVEITGNASNAFTIALYKYDMDDGVLDLRHHVSLSSNFDPDVKIEMGDGLIGKVAKTRQPFIDEHLEQDPIDLHIYKKKENLKSFLAMPVVFKKLEGVLVIDSKESYSFPAKQQKIITGLVSQMAWHLNQERKGALGEEPNESLFRDLVSYCRFIAESPDKNTATDRLGHVPASILKCDAYAVIWFNSDEMGKVAKYQGFNKDVVNISIQLGKGLAGSCAKNRCPVLLRNTADRQTVIFGSDEKKEPFLSLMAAPVAFNNQLYGVMVCGSKSAGLFSDSELNRLTLMTSSAASAIFCDKTRARWNYNKNLDQITGVPNHRFLTEHGNALEKDVLQDGSPSCVLSLQVTNLPELYESFGIEYGDRLQRQMASTLSKTLPSPKYIIKYSDTAYIMILINQNQSDVLPFKERLTQVFNKTPFFIDGKSMPVNAELGISSFPENGNTLSQLIGISLPKSTSQPSSETKVTS